MAAIGFLEALLNGLTADEKKALVAFTREAFKTLSFGAPGASAVSAQNFGAHLVPYVTHATPNTEVAVAHSLGRTPRWLMPGLPTNTVNATNPVITITKAADATYLYLKSATASASGWLYVE